MPQQVYIIDYSIISALGSTSAIHLKALKEGITGVHQQSLEGCHLDLPFGAIQKSNDELIKSLKNLAHLPAELLKNLPRAILLHTLALERLNHWFEYLPEHRVALISANTVGGIDKTISYKNDNTVSLNYHEAGRITQKSLALLGRESIKYSTISTACSSSANSIIMGSKLIEQGHYDLVIAGGVDALTAYTAYGFNALKILDANWCRPFHKNRSGLNLGEGAGFVVLASKKWVQEQTLPIKAILKGYGNANDAYHQTASSPNGLGNFLAIQKALEKAQLTMKDIDYINAHGTGTINNDESEHQAILRHLKGTKLPYLSSTKTYTGHTLGAAGVIEAIFCIMAIEHQMIWGQGNPGELIHQPSFKWVEKTMEHPVHHILSNSFGFGGNCSTLLISKI